MSSRVWPWLVRKQTVGQLCYYNSVLSLAINNGTKDIFAHYFPTKTLLTLQQIYDFSFHRLLGCLIVQLQHQDLQRKIGRCKLNETGM